MLEKEPDAESRKPQAINVEPLRATDRAIRWYAWPVHPTSIFHTHDVATLVARLRANPFLVFAVCGTSSALFAHAPALISDDGTELRFHLSRNNSLVPLLAAGARLRATSTGAHAYISPDWYGIDDQVPTWNYESVEVEGGVSILDAAEAVRFLDDLSNVFEATLSPKKPWTRATMSDGLFERMLHGIVAYRMNVTALVGTSKLSQNKPASAQRGVIHALGEEHPIARAMTKNLA